MIDFIRVQYKDKFRFEPFVCREENFDSLMKTFDAHTGEITYPYKAKKENMDVVVCHKTGYVKNSLHKLHNVLDEGKEHNYNDFTYSMLCETIDYLSNKIEGVTINSLTQVEFGLNIHIDEPAEQFIKNNVLMYDFKNYNHNRKFRGKGELKQFVKTNYMLKIYDKAKQYKLDENILRYEIKYTRRREFNNLGVYNLNDLKNKITLRRLFINYMKRFNNLTIIDSINGIENMEENDSIKLRKFMNPYYWEVEMKPFTNQTVSRHRKQFKELIEKYQLDSKKKEIKKLLYKKFIYLMNN